MEERQKGDVSVQEWMEDRKIGKEDEHDGERERERRMKTLRKRERERDISPIVPSESLLVVSLPWRLVFVVTPTWRPAGQPDHRTCCRCRRGC